MLRSSRPPMPARPPLSPCRPVPFARAVSWSSKAVPPRCVPGKIVNPATRNCVPACLRAPRVRGRGSRYLILFEASERVLELVDIPYTWQAPRPKHRRPRAPRFPSYTGAPSSDARGFGGVFSQLSIAEKSIDPLHRSTRRQRHRSRYASRLT